MSLILAKDVDILLLALAIIHLLFVVYFLKLTITN